MNARLHPAATTSAPLRDRLQRPLRDLRLSVIDACNFRCGYCMPADRVADDHGLDSSQRLDFDQIETLVRAFVRHGVSKLRPTGGEPLLRRGLSALGGTVGGDRRHRRHRHDHQRHVAGTACRGLAPGRTASGDDQPRRAGAGVVRALVRRPRPHRGCTCGHRRPATAVGLPVKLNCVIQRGVNEDQVLPLVGHFRGSGHVLRFIEYMDVGSCNGWRAGEVVRSAELRERIHARWPLRPLDPQYQGEVAQSPRLLPTVPAKWVSSVRSASRSGGDLPPRTGLGRWPALHLPVRRWRQRPPAGPGARAGCAGRDPRHVVGRTRRPL